MNPNDNIPMTREERWREDYYYFGKYNPQEEKEMPTLELLAEIQYLKDRLEKVEELICEAAPVAWANAEFLEDAHKWEIRAYDWLHEAADLARKEARRVKADKLIKFLKKPENA